MSIDISKLVIGNKRSAESLQICITFETTMFRYFLNNHLDKIFV